MYARGLFIAARAGFFTRMRNFAGGEGKAKSGRRKIACFIRDYASLDCVLRESWKFARTFRGCEYFESLP